MTLEKAIKTAEKINKDLNGDIEKCSVELLAAEAATDTCDSKNTDLNRRINDINEKLNCCQNDRQTDAGEFRDLKNKFEDLSKELDECKCKNVNFTELLTACRADDTADAIELQKEIAELRSTQGLLQLCRSRTTEVETSYESEKTKVLTLTKRVEEIRVELDEARKNYDIEIRKSSGDLDQCRFTLKSETDSKTVIQIEVTRLQVQITELQTTININLKVRPRLRNFS